MCQPNPGTTTESPRSQQKKLGRERKACTYANGVTKNGTMSLIRCSIEQNVKDPELTAPRTVYIKTNTA